MKATLFKAMSEDLALPDSETKLNDEKSLQRVIFEEIKAIN